MRGVMGAPPDKKDIVYDLLLGESNSVAVGFSHVVRNFNNGVTTSAFFNCPELAPTEWDNSKNPKIRSIGIADATGSSQDYLFEFGIITTSFGSVVNPVEDVTISEVIAAPDTDQEFFATPWFEIDKNEISIGDNIAVIFRRIGDDIDDTRGGAYFISKLQISFPRK